MSRSQIRNDLATIWSLQLALLVVLSTYGLNQRWPSTETIVFGMNQPKDFFRARCDFDYAYRAHLSLSSRRSPQLPAVGD